MTFVKICGIKTLKDALAAIEAGANYLVKRQKSKVNSSMQRIAIPKG